MVPTLFFLNLYSIYLDAALNTCHSSVVTIIKAKFLGPNFRNHLLFLIKYYKTNILQLCLVLSKLQHIMLAVFGSESSKRLQVWDFARTITKSTK